MLLHFFIQNVGFRTETNGNHIMHMCSRSYTRDMLDYILKVLVCVCVCVQKAVELPRRSLSPVLSAVVWTLLSCGILLAFCFLVFTLRFKNNR